MNWCLKQICILTDIHSGTTSECRTRCRGSCISLELLTFLKETVCIIMVRYLYISNLYIFPSNSPYDIFSINGLTDAERYLNSG